MVSSTTVRVAFKYRSYLLQFRIPIKSGLNQAKMNKR